jgi:hypothetical protein
VTSVDWGQWSEEGVRICQVFFDRISRNDLTRLWAPEQVRQVADSWGIWPWEFVAALEWGANKETCQRKVSLILRGVGRLADLLLIKEDQLLALIAGEICVLKEREDGRLKK